MVNLQHTFYLLLIVPDEAVRRNVVRNTKNFYPLKFFSSFLHVISWISGKFTTTTILIVLLHIFNGSKFTYCTSYILYQLHTVPEGKHIIIDSVNKPAARHLKNVRTFIAKGAKFYRRGAN